jgi:signal transduction histidine kinase/ligand-binding sensor domain-containing protein
MWFGTQNGLNKFDGYSFESYFFDPSDTASISNSWIFNITEDNNGLLWIGTKGGLNRFDRKTGLFTRVSTTDVNSEDNTNFIYGVTSDSSNIYINQPPILSVLNFNTGSLESYTNTIERDRALYDKGFPIIKDSKGVIWMGSLRGLSSFDLQNKQFKNYTHNVSDPNTISDNHITALYEDKYGNILIGTENGLNIYNKKIKIINRFYADNGRPGSLSHNFIRSITQDYTGAIWIGTDGGGLNKMTYSGPAGYIDFIHFRGGPGKTNFISHDQVYSLYEDNSNNLWIGTLTGVDKTDLKKKSIRTYMKSDDPNSIDLLDNVIASVYQDSDGKLWIGNWGKGLNILDRGTNEVIHYSSELTGEKHIPQNHVHVIFKDSKSRIWLGTRNGVSIFDKNRNLFIPVQDYFNAPDFNYFSNNRVYCIIEDSWGKIWIGTGNGIIILNTETNGTTLIQMSYETTLEISSNLVYSLLEDKDQNIWIATSNGLNRYVPSENKIYNYVNNPDSSNTLCNNLVASLCEDRRGNIWIGTSTGVNMFDKADAVFSYYTLKDGLPSNIIYDIIKDGNDNLWFSTGNGLAMKNPDENAFETFLVEDKLLGKEFTIKAAFKAADGEMFFGAVDGLVSFYPDSLIDNNYIPPIRITSLEKETNGVRQEINPYSGRILLSYQDYSFTIEFSALDYTNPSKNRYSYQMDGISDNWIEIGNRRFVDFTNLPPGEYTFNVKGSNNDGVWNNEGASMSITILPPWWRSKYAYIFYIIFIIAIIIVLIRIRERSFIREKIILEEKIRERTTEIAQQKKMVEDALKNLKQSQSQLVESERMASIGQLVAGIAHEINNPVTFISAGVDSLNTNLEEIRQVLDIYHRITLDNAEEKLKEIEKLKEKIEYNEAIREINKLIDSVKTGTERTTEIVKGLRTFSRLDEDVLKMADVHEGLDSTLILLRNKYKQRIEILKHYGKIPDIECYPGQLNQVFMNFLTNAIDAIADMGTITISTSKSNGSISISIKDTGRGIPENIKPRIFEPFFTTKEVGQGTGLGLSICHSIIEKHRGTIEVKSEAGKGSEFVIMVPMKQSER